MPRTVLLPGGIPIRNVPDDVTDEEVERQYEESQRKKREAAQEREPQATSEPEGDREESPRGGYQRPRVRSNVNRFSEPEEETTHPLESAVRFAKGVAGTIKGFGDEVGRVIKGGVIAPMINTAIDVNTMFGTEEERLKKKAIAATFLNQHVGSSMQGSQDGSFTIQEDTGVLHSERPETLAGAVAPYLVGGTKTYSLVGQGVKLAPGLMQKFVTGAISGSITEQLLTNPYDVAIFNAMDDFFNPEQKNAVLNFLATDEDDSLAEARLKTALQDATFMSALMTVPAMTKAIGLVGGEVSERLLKSPTATLTDKESSKLMVSLLNMMRRKPRANIANPGQRPRVQQTVSDADANLEEITRLGTHVGGPIRTAAHKTWNFIANQVFSSKGYMTDDQFKLFQQSASSQRATLQRAEFMAYRMNNMIRRTAAQVAPDDAAQYGWIATKQSDEVAENVAKEGDRIAGLVSGAIRGDDEAIKALTPELRAIAKEARQFVDSMTNELMDSPAITKELRETLEGNLGEYMRRSYKLFTDSTYKPSESVFLEAQEELANRLLRSNASSYSNITEIGSAREQAKDILDKILTDRQVTDYTAFTNRMMRINDAVLRKKKDLTPALRRFLGEETDPAMNIVQTIEGMADLVYKGRFYESMHTMGNGKWLFPGNAPKGIFNTTISGTNSILDGMVTSPEMAKVMMGQQTKLIGDTVGGNAAFRGYFWLKGISQKAKTVYSHPTHMKNIVGGFGFRAANGYAPFSPNSQRAFRTISNQIRNGGDKELEKIYDELLDLGIINTNTRVGEFRQLINDGMGNPQKLVDQISTSLDRSASEGSRNLSLWAQAPDKVYMGTDDYFKANTYFDYLDTLKRAYPQASEQSLKQEAAAVTRNIIPNYDLVPNAVKELRKLPLSNFAGFSSEVIRTTVNIYKQAYKEITSGNSVLIEKGLNRAFGITAMVGGGVGAGADISQRLMGFEDFEQRSAFLELAERPYSENPTVFTQRDENGDIYFLDMSTINPYTFMEKPFTNALHQIIEGRMSEQAFDEMMMEATGSFMKATLGPFASVSIATEPFLTMGRVALVDGRTMDGTLIRAPGTTGLDTGLAIAHAFWDSIEPGTLTALGRAFDAATERPLEPAKLPRDQRSELEASFSGMRWTKLRPIESLMFAVGDYNRDKRGMTSMAPKLTDTPQDVLERYRRVNKAHYDSQVKLFRKIDALRTLGTPINEIRRTLKEEGLAENEVDWLMSGRYRSPIDVQSLMMGTFDKVFTEERRDTNAYTMGWRELRRELGREGSAMQGVSLSTFAAEENQSIHQESRDDAIEILRTGGR